MLTNITEITDYFETDNFRSDEKVTMVNDIYLTGTFIKCLVTKLGGRVNSFTASLDRYYWRDDKTIKNEGIKFPIADKNSNLVFEVMYDGANYKNTIYIRDDTHGVVHFSIGGKRRSLKVTDTESTINLKWLILQLEENIKKIAEHNAEKKVAAFQASLAIPWMTQMLVNVGIEESSITASNSNITIKGFDRNAYWSVVNLYPSTSESATSFEDLSWYINIKGKIRFSNISGNNIVKMIDVFKSSGYFKK